MKSGKTLQYYIYHVAVAQMNLQGLMTAFHTYGVCRNFAGAPWTAKQLRTKSNTDLHKLW